MTEYTKVEKEVYDTVLKNNADLFSEIEHLKWYDRIRTEDMIKIEKKLSIAVKALEEYANTDFWADSIGEDSIVYNCCFCEEGYKDAEEALKQIKEVK